jgi:hypothetical protein
MWASELAMLAFVSKHCGLQNVVYALIQFFAADALQLHLPSKSAAQESCRCWCCRC